MDRSLFRLILIVTLLLSMNNGNWGFAEEPEWTEAQKVFQELADSENPYIAKMAQDNLNQLREKLSDAVPPPKQVEIPILTRNNSSIAVPAVLDKHVMGTFLVDTGATYTVITPRIAKKLGIDLSRPKRIIRITTANGTVRAPVVTVPTITIGGLQVSQVDVIVQPLGDDILLAGLLGMNFFKDMEITFKRDKLVLTPSPVKTAQR